MKQNNPSVTVGIVAYNEEANIRRLLSAIVKQKQSNWTLSDIILSCGGCTDRTVPFAKASRIPNLCILVNPKRVGKAVDEQKIIDTFRSDILVLFDADVLPSHTGVIDALVQALESDPSVVLAGGNARAVNPTNFISHAVYSTFRVLEKSRDFVGDGNNIYGCSGQCLAMKRQFAKTIRFPSGILAEDDYIYFSCIAGGYRFRYCKDAVVMYRLPTTLADYVRQVFRADPDAAGRNVTPYFGSIVSESYRRPVFPYTRAVWQEFVRNPSGVLLMILVRLLSKIAGPAVAKNYRLSWFTAATTHRV